MKRIAGLVLMLAVSAFAFWGDNTTGYGDTANIHSFRSDSIKYTPWFRLSSYLDLRIDMFADDTSSAGYGSDSIKFIWGIQTGHTVLNSSNSRDTLISNYLVAVDTFDRAGGKIRDTTLQIDVNGDFVYPHKMIDTSNVSGFAYQTANISPEWDAWYRGFVKGITGNKVGSYIKARMSFIRREKLP